MCVYVLFEGLTLVCGVWCGRVVVRGKAVGRRQCQVPTLRYDPHSH